MNNTRFNLIRDRAAHSPAASARGQVPVGRREPGKPLTHPWRVPATADYLASLAAADRLVLTAMVKHTLWRNGVRVVAA